MERTRVDGSHSGDTAGVVDGAAKAEGRSFDDDVKYAALRVAELIISRHKKYGPKNIANSPGGALNGITVRLYDKLARLEHGNKDFADESVTDTVLDVAGYGIIALLVLQDQWPR